jgi:hypothetical protein
MHVGSLAGALGRPARIAGGLDLLRSPQVGLGNLYVFLRARDLTFMSF